MADVAQIPPLQGCLYCHAEGTLTLHEGRKILGLGGDYPTVKCSRCESGWPGIHGKWQHTGTRVIRAER